MPLSFYAINLHDVSFFKYSSFFIFIDLEFALVSDVLYKSE